MAMSIIEVGKVIPGHSETSISSGGYKYSHWRMSPNSAGGVGIHHKAYNASEKIIKYLTFTYIPYNQVGDVVQSKTDGKIEATGRITGPIDPNKEIDVEWDVMWYNPTISMAVIKEVKVEYMDGSEEIIPGSDIKNIDSKDSIYYQKIGKAKEEEQKADEEKRKEKEKNDKMKSCYKSLSVLSNLKEAKTNEELKFHVNQGLWLLIIEIIAILMWGIPYVGGILGLVLIAVAVTFSIIGIRSVEKDEKKSIPFIGNIIIFK